MANSLIMHSTAAGGANLASIASVARRSGFHGIEVEYGLLNNYFQAGLDGEQLKHDLRDLTVPGVGWIQDIERQGQDFAQLLHETEPLLGTLHQAGVKGLQVLTGPLDWRAVDAHRRGVPHDGYQGLLDQTTQAQIELTQRNLIALAKLAADYGIVIYVEPLGWTPVGSIVHGARIIEDSSLDNLKLLVDFWHCYAAGDSPDSVARIPADAIYGVHVCDSLEIQPGTIPDESVSRNVRLGNGVLDIPEWVSAVQSTGYNEWWACEVFDLKQRQYPLQDSADASFADISKQIDVA